MTGGSQVSTIPGQTTQTYSYAYDAGSRLTQQITPDGTSNFTYDHDNQLTADSQGSGSYSYDSNGNRTSTSSGGTPTTSTVGADNQITSSGSTTYTYDKQGNLTSQDTGSPFDTYIWDNRNRLSAVNIEAGLNYSYVGYSYNSQNQLISRYTSTNIFNGSTSTQTNQVYVWDGNNLLAVLNVDLPTGVATVAQRFLSGQGENQIIAQENASSTGEAGLVSWAITDNTGSVVDVVANGSGNTILDHIVYDSFGNTVSQTNSANAILMGYQGYILDSITGLYYANARYYSPQLGRFISQYPSGFSAGDANLYR
ncbi:MAG: RHS repeat-associated core domain-containing protein, partial [Phycisphaerae bacterium]